MDMNKIFSSYLSGTILIWVITIFLLALTIIFVYALFYRFRNNHIERNMLRLRPVFTDLVSCARNNKITDEQIRDIISKKDFRCFGRFLRDAISSIGECDVSAELRIADVSGFSGFLRRRIMRGQGWRQALDLRTLSYLRSKDNAEIFMEIIKASDFPPSILAAGLGLALSDNYGSMEEVFKKVYENTGCNEDVLLMMASAYGKEACSFLHELLKNKKLSMNESSVIVDALGNYRFTSSKETLVDMLKSVSELELSLHIMDALKFIGDKELAKDLLPYLNHENYIMRVKAAFTISVLGGASYIPSIEPLLYDEKWWVRRNAAEAVLNTGAQGLKRLKELSQTAEEYPRTAAQLILTDLQFNKLGLVVDE